MAAPLAAHKLQLILFAHYSFITVLVLAVAAILSTYLTLTSVAELDAYRAICCCKCIRVGLNEVSSE